MTEHYKTKLIEMLDKLSEKALKRLISLQNIFIFTNRKAARNEQRPPRTTHQQKRHSEKA